MSAIQVEMVGQQVEDVASYLRPVSRNSQANLESVLRQAFPTQQEETRLQLVRRIMGETVLSIPDEELEVYLTEIRFLLDAWMNEFERELFNNKTLQQVLMEG